MVSGKSFSGGAHIGVTEADYVLSELKTSWKVTKWNLCTSYGSIDRKRRGRKRSHCTQCFSSFSWAPSLDWSINITCQGPSMLPVTILHPLAPFAFHDFYNRVPVKRYSPKFMRLGKWTSVKLYIKHSGECGFGRLMTWNRSSTSYVQRFYILWQSVFTSIYKWIRLLTCDSGALDIGYCTLDKLS